MKEAPYKASTLEAGPVKCVYIDRHAAAAGLPCWLVYLPETDTIYRALSARTINPGGLSVRFQGNKSNPLLPTGPSFWAETTAAIEVLI